jgi:hypothetical protein
MFSQLLFTSTLLFVVVQAAVTNNLNGQTAAALTLPKQAPVYDDYDLNDNKTTVEGSGGGTANLDEYVDDEEDNQLSKVTATTIISLTSATTPKLTTIKNADQK